MTARKGGSGGDVSAHREAARGSPEQPGRHPPRGLSQRALRPITCYSDTATALRPPSLAEDRSGVLVPEESLQGTRAGPSGVCGVGPRGAGRPPPLRPDQHCRLGDRSRAAGASAQGTRRRLERCCSITGRHPALLSVPAAPLPTSGASRVKRG